MTSKNTIPMRSDKELKQLLEEVSLERFRLGKDKRPLTLPRLTKAISRIPNLKEVLIGAQMNEK